MGSWQGGRPATEAQGTERTRPPGQEHLSSSVLWAEVLALNAGVQHKVVQVCKASKELVLQKLHRTWQENPSVPEPSPFREATWGEKDEIGYL